VKVEILIACFILSAGALPSCERDTSTSEDAKAYLNEDGQKIKELERRVGELERKMDDLERQIRH
jgi:uncharacterized protein Yka (UPF0111/DUF47 family)